MFLAGIALGNAFGGKLADRYPEDWPVSPIIGEDPEAKVAMVTAMGQQGVIMEAIKAGARDFVVKPFDADRIQAALWKLVA